MATSDDIGLIDKHLSALLAEVADLRGAVEQNAMLEREATLRDVFDALRPAIDALDRFRAWSDQCSESEVVEELAEALLRLGLEHQGSPGEVLELWPEEAREDYILDRSVPADAAMVRVEILSSGWRRRKKVVARPVARVLEVIDENDPG